ncbi:MAG: conjugal transfer protein TraF [Rickettsiaceae bacterium]|nr:conjugal transfer protein TraF [Rickettsiaceae bacterium]
MRVSISLKYIPLFILFLGVFTNCYAKDQVLEGYNWYNEKPILPKEKNLKKNNKPQESKPEDTKELPEYEKNIRALQEKHKAAHRQALDNPTIDNILKELDVEKEMIDKSQIYAERRVAIGMLDSQYTDMKQHSNIMHIRVQEQVESKETSQKLKKLSQDWGLILQVAPECPHCHSFAPIVLEFAQEYGFQLLASNKDGSDFNGIEGVRDNGEMLIFNPNRETPILYLVKGDGKEVYPISRGIHSADQIILNLKKIDQHIRRLF